MHHDAEVTEAGSERPHLVTQAFCSALPVAYTTGAAARWKPFAWLVLSHGPPRLAVELPATARGSLRAHQGSKLMPPVSARVVG